jgi:hypothetical protein
MLRAMEVLGRVPVWRLVAAANVAAGLAHAQVDPFVAEGHALGTNVVGIVP